MNSKQLIPTKLEKQEGALKSLFSGEVESTRDRLQRQQIVNDLNYGLESTFVEKDPEEEELGNIYDFDGFLDEKEKKEEKAKKDKKEKQPSRYIAKLKQRADERKREMEIVRERTLLKERQKEDALYEGKEKFVTAAYKRKLEADRKYLEEVRQREVNSRSSKSSFLAHMIDVQANEEKPEEQNVPSVDNRGSVVNESPVKVTDPQEEEDEFDGFIMAPQEDQIQGNVSDDDAGFITAPKDEDVHHHRSRSRSHSRHRHHHHYHNRH